MATILIVEDQPENQQLYDDIVHHVEKDLGLQFRHLLASGFEEAQQALERGLEYPEEAPALILLDMELPYKGRMDKRGGYRLMQQYREKFADACWVPLTASIAWHKKETPGEAPLFDDLYRLQPFAVSPKGKTSNLKDIVCRALKLIRETSRKETQQEYRDLSEEIIEIEGQLYAITDYRLYNQLRSAANAENTRGILLFGEPGTGKTIKARLIHYFSGRQKSAFYIADGTLDTKSLGELLFPSENSERVDNLPSLLDQAQGGTLYISDFDQMGKNSQEDNLRLQRQLLHHLKYRNCDVHIIGGISKNRKDFPLFNRILPELLDSMIPIDIPSLRERKGDIPVLVDLFFKQFNRDRQARGEKPKQIVDLPEIYELLQAQDWRECNISQLQTVIKEVLFNSSTLAITVEDFEAVLAKNVEQSAPQTTKATTATDEKRQVKEASEMIAEAAEKKQMERTIEVTTATGEKRQIKITEPPLITTDEDLRKFGIH